MKNKTKKQITYSIERVILSDVLPYETPIVFSNKHFYNFLLRYDIKFEYNKTSDRHYIQWKNCSQNEIIETVVRLLFDIKSISANNQPNIIFFGKNEERKKPFNYKITHKEKDFRELSVPHPKSQIELISFYDEFKELIIYYSNQSNFSIRRPSRIAKFVYTNDSTHNKNIGSEDDVIEESDKEYKSLKTFFAYKKYSNIYRFYEDYIYHRSEKKYAKMLKFDISKCFDSIYTHSISWALIDKDFVKNNLGLERKTFSGKFDKFIQNTNFGETNGIIIGPEFSRIFAELILQQIDKKAEEKLRLKKLYHKRDFEIFRYVDDFFVFYNNEETKKSVLNIYKILLKDYKMSLNDSKTKLYQKPLITEITIAKNKIVNLIKNEIKFKIRPEEEREDIHTNNKILESDEKPLKKILASDIDIKCNSNRLITEYKTIIVESKVGYKDVMNYTLALLKNNIDSNIKKYEKHKRSIEERKLNNLLSSEERKILGKQDSGFRKYVVEMLDFTFFLYGVSPKVNSTIKLVNILTIIIEAYKKTYRLKPENSAFENEYRIVRQFDKLNQEVVFKKIFDEIALVLDKNKVSEHIQIETLYLLITLRELGKDYRLTVPQLIKYLNLNELKDVNNNNYKSKRYAFKDDINYFVMTVLLFYFKDIQQYKNLQGTVKNAIRKKIKTYEKGDISKHAEIVFLLFDIISCPYLNENNKEFKKEILKLVNIPSEKREDFIKFVEKQKYWYIKWDKFDLIKELNSKNSLEPY